MTATPKDLQDEVGRLRDALEDAKEALMDGSGAGVFWRESAVERINKALQTPPESADENPLNKVEPQIRHKRMQAFNQKLEELGVVDNPAQSSPPQACEHWWWTPDMSWTRCRICGAEYLGPQVSRREPQPCEHKSIDTYQGKPFCKRCGQTVEISSPQEPNGD